MQTSNPYILGDATIDRYRLETQTRLYSDYIRANARRLVGDDVGSILDLGCGEGQLGLVLREVYPDASLLGIDRDAKAISVAQNRAIALGGKNVAFVVGDITQGLPDQQFDLVYASLILEHTRNPESLVRSIYQHLNPGGHLWIKDIEAAIMAAFDHLSYKRLGQMSLDTMVKLGVHPYVADELSTILPEAGFSNIVREQESYPLGGSSEAGRTTLALGLGAFFNARGVMEQVMGVPKQEIEQLYLDVVNAAMRNPKLEGELTLANIIAQKPTS